MVKIVSGGQTGVDRAALDAAIARGLSYGGWCPKGGWAEDMPVPPGLLQPYPLLRETPLADPLQRTEWNIRDSDRLMVLLDDRGSTSRGTEHAIRQARALDRPVIVLDVGRRADVDRAAAWLCQGGGERAICVAGPRESEAPGIYEAAREFLDAALARDHALG